MNFGSTIFLFLFLPISLLLYFPTYLIQKNNKLRIQLQNFILLVLSGVFIWWISPIFLMLAVMMMLINFIGGLLMTCKIAERRIVRRDGWGKILFILLLFINLGVLVYYKYFIHITILPTHSLINKIIIPLGLSFYTFSLIRYVLDVFSGKIEAEVSLVNFGLFVLFFPKFVSGPIERYEHFGNQIKNHPFSRDQFYEGILRFVIGVNKKVLIVGLLSEVTSPVFELNSIEWTAPLAWGGILIYGLQLFIDFDAYCDMAIGLGKMFGFELMENFNLPYLATSIQDFWNRWHISLSSWLQDTILLPFQFQTRRKNPKWLFAILGILFTFLISGLWHGDSWNFALWGIWHGVFLSLETLFLRKWLDKIPVLLQRCYAFLIVMVGWVFFRLDSLNEIGAYLSKLFVPQSFDGILYRGLMEFSRIDVILAIVFALLISFGVFKKIEVWTKEKGIGFEMGMVALLFVLFGLSIMQLYNGYFQPFLYAQF